MNRRVSTSFFEIVYVFLTLITLSLFKNAMKNDGMENEEKKQFVCHSLATFLASYYHQIQIYEQV